MVSWKNHQFSFFGIGWLPICHENHGKSRARIRMESLKFMQQFTYLVIYLYLSSYLFNKMFDPIYLSMYLHFTYSIYLFAYQLPTYLPIWRNYLPMFMIVYVLTVFYLIVIYVSFCCICARDWFRGHPVLLWWSSAAAVIPCNTISGIDDIIKLFFQIVNSEEHGQVTLQSKHAYHYNSLMCVIQILTSLAPAEVKSKQSSPTALLSSYPVDWSNFDSFIDLFWLIDWIGWVKWLDSLVDNSWIFIRINY